MTSFEQAIARSKLEHAEKYGTSKLADLDMIRRMLNYQIDFSDDRRQAVIHAPHGNISVTINTE